MEVVLTPDPGDGTVAAVRAAAARAGMSFEPGRCRTPDPWWRAGLAEAIDRVPAGPPRPVAYEAAPSPRSTRGATRA